VSKELAKAREQLDAGEYKKALRTLWEAERWARDDVTEARGLLEVASAIRDQTTGRTRDESLILIEDARKYIEREMNSTPRVSLGMTRYLGGCQPFGAARNGRLSFAADAIFLDSVKLDMALVKSVAVGGGQVAKSRVGATLAFGIAGLASKGTEDRTELAIHLTSGEAAFFVVEGESPFEVRAKLLPRLREAGVPFEDEIDDQAELPAATASAGSGYSLADELMKLADLRKSGFLTDEELAAAKAKLLS
jgi:hypothetical protein